MTTIHSHVLKLASELLDIASDSFSNHGCNDHEIDNTPENWALLVAMEQRNDPTFSEDISEIHHLSRDGKIVVSDWFLMWFLARVLEDAAKEATQ